MGQEKVPKKQVASPRLGLGRDEWPFLPPALQKDTGLHWAEKEIYFSSSGIEGFFVGVWLPELEPYLHLSSFFLQGV